MYGKSFKRMNICHQTKLNVTIIVFLKRQNKFSSTYVILDAHGKKPQQFLFKTTRYVKTH